MQISSSIRVLIVIASVALSADAFMTSNQLKSFAYRRSQFQGKADHINDVTGKIQFFNDTGFSETKIVEAIDFVDAAAPTEPSFDVSRLEFVPTCGIDHMEECLVDQIYHQLLEIDEAGKSGGMPLEISMDVLIFDLSNQHR